MLSKPHMIGRCHLRTFARIGAAGALAILGLGGLTTFAPSKADAQSQASPAMPANIVTAVADPARPAADRARDADRKPAEVLAFADVKPGDTVVDLIPGGGYFTRVFSKAVGPSGHVYALVPSFLAKAYPQSVAAIQAVAADPAYRNVTVWVEGVGKLATQGPVDLVWTSQNYHDLHGPSLPPDTASAIDHAVLTALRPGGVYIIEDHAAEAGSGVRDAGVLHRIDPAFVRDEVETAGFTFEAESPVLHNARDPRTARVFDPTIRGHTDQFVFKFRKPS
jgi:predicted methyltransferase